MRAKQAIKRSSRAPAPPRQHSGTSSTASSSLAGAAMDRKGPSTSAAAAPMAMAALAAAAAAGQQSSSDQADGALPPNREEDNRPATLAAAVGGSGASGTSPAVAAARKGAAGGGPSCQVERCAADLQEAKRYHRRHKVCEPHAKALVVLVAGLRQRFCQQCSRFHELLEFDDVKHSCRRRLAGHNERRRKSSADRHGSGDQDGRSHPGNPSRNHFQIR